MQVVNIVASIKDDFQKQSNPFGLLFGYNTSNESYLISFAAPDSFQSFGNDVLLNEVKEDLYNLLEDFHCSVNAISLIGFIAKEQDKIAPSALKMKAQEFYVTISKRLKIKGSFYLCTVLNNNTLDVQEKKSGQQFAKVEFKEIQDEDLVQINATAELNIRNMMSVSKASEKLVTQTIVESSQCFLSEYLGDSCQLLIDNILIFDNATQINEISKLPQKQINMQFIPQSNEEEDQFISEPFEFNFKGHLSTNFKVHNSVTVSQAKELAAGGIRKELQTRISQFLGDEFSQKSLVNVKESEIQLPSKLQSNILKNCTLSAFVSHPEIVTSSSCIFESVQLAEEYFSKQLKQPVQFRAVDHLNLSQYNAKAQISATAKSQSEPQQESGQNNQQQAGQVQEDNGNKRNLAYFVFSLAILLMGYLFMKI